MDFPAHLRPSSILLAPQVADKWALLADMVRALQASWDFSEELYEVCLRCVLEREKSVSTGMEAGIAVPHAAVDGLPTMVMSMALIPEGLEFGSLDGKPAQVVVMILVPKQEKLMHLQTLTEVARRLGNQEFRQALLAAASAEEVLRLWN